MRTEVVRLRLLAFCHVYDLTKWVDYEVHGLWIVLGKNDNHFLQALLGLCDPTSAAAQVSAARALLLTARQEEKSRG